MRHRESRSPDYLPTSRHQRSRGFTIVELLVVIVVIAILATISIVAYNGIQNRARTASVSAALSQAAKKLPLYAADNSGSYPATSAVFFTEVGADSSGKKGDVTLQYSVNNSADPKTFCITGTAGNISYKITQTGAPSQGGCAGHGQGGTAAITNQILNPSAEADVSGWEAVYGMDGSGTLSRVASGSLYGSSLGRITWSASPTSSTTSGLWILSTGVVPSAGGKTFTASAYVRASWSGMSVVVNAVPYRASYVYNGGEVNGPSVALSATTWAKVSATITAPAGTEYIKVRVRAIGGTMPPVNATLDADGFMLTEGTAAYDFADGNSPNWIWNGSPNNSTSTGPAL